MMSNWKHMFKLLNDNIKFIRKFSHASDLVPYDFRRLTPVYLEPTWNIMSEIFFKEDEFCKMIGLSESPEARQELRFFFDMIVKDDAGYIAMPKDEKKVVAICLGKLWVPNEVDYLKRKVDTLTHSSCKHFIQQFTDYDMFNYFKVDCVFEGMIAAALPEVRGKGLSSKLIRLLYDLAKDMSLSEEKLKDVKIPKVYYSADTAITNHIVKKIQDNSVNYEKTLIINGEKKTMKWYITYEYLNDRKL